MSDKKLLLSDLDGTLLNSAKEISPATREALKDFAARGNSFAICTGRAMDSARTVCRTLGLDFPGSFIVSYNGAMIYDNNKKEVIYRAGVPMDIAREILKLGEEMQVHVHTYNDRYIVGKEYDECMAFYRRHIRSAVIITDDVLGELSEEPCKMIAIELHDHEKEERFRAELERRYSDVLTTIYSNDYYLEIFSREAGKGNAVRRLTEYLGIPLSASMAAGDAENDLSMIEAAGLGIAMCNGSDAVKTAADVITETDNDHDGLVPFLR